MADKMICTQCGTTGKTKSFTRGSTGAEIILWLFFLVPGLIYSMWRLSSRSEVCASCSSQNVVPVHSPVGRELMRKYNPAQPVDEQLPKGNAVRGWLWIAALIMLIAIIWAASA